MFIPNTSPIGWTALFSGTSIAPCNESIIARIINYDLNSRVFNHSTENSSPIDPAPQWAFSNAFFNPGGTVNLHAQFVNCVTGDTTDANQENCKIQVIFTGLSGGLVRRDIYVHMKFGFIVQASTGGADWYGVRSDTAVLPDILLDGRIPIIVPGYDGPNVEAFRIRGGQCTLFPCDGVPRCSITQSNGGFPYDIEVTYPLSTDPLFAGRTITLSRRAGSPTLHGVWQFQENNFGTVYDYELQLIIRKDIGSPGLSVLKSEVKRNGTTVYGPIAGSLSGAYLCGQQGHYTLSDGSTLRGTGLIAP